jgi:serine/threonine protein kinase
MDQGHSLAAPEVCPACGMAYPAGTESAGCPVCLLRGALESEATSEGGTANEALARPEQCAAASVDARSDLYSLGITLRQMLTGQAPFRGTPAEVMRQHLRAPLPVEQLERVPQPAVALLEALLEKHPARRLQTPAQLLQALPKVRGALKAARFLTPQDLQKRLLATSGTGAHKPPAPRGPKEISAVRRSTPGCSTETNRRRQSIKRLSGCGQPDSSIHHRKRPADAPQNAGFALRAGTNKTNKAPLLSLISFNS